MSPDRDESVVRELLTPLAHLTYDADAAWRSLRSRLDTAPQVQRGSRRLVPRPLVSALGVGAVVIAIVISSIVIVVGHGQHGPKPPTITPAGSLRSFTTNIHDVTTFTDTAGGLWLSSWNDAILTRIDPQTGAPTSLKVGQPTSGIIAAASADGELFDIRFDTGQLEARDATSGVVVRSTKLQAETNTLTALGNQLWVTACCRSSTPSQTVQTIDPSTLAATSVVVVPQEGETAQVAAGPAGVWFMNEDSTWLQRVDSPRVVVIGFAQPGNVGQVAIGASVVVVANGLGQLDVYNATTGAAESPLEYGVIQSDVIARAAAVDGDTVYVAIPGHVLEFSIAKKAKIGDVTGLNVQRLSVGPHGVWAATDGSVAQIATS
jgi:hypothetical protein